MRIIGLVHKDSGVSYHRVIMPLMLLQDPEIDVFITNNILEEHFEKGCDILLYNRTLPEHAIETLKKLQAIHGFKVVLDIDDFWELDKHHILYEYYQEEEFAKRQVEQLKAADMVITTHERLAMEVVSYNKNVHVCPNAIPHQGQFDIAHIKEPNGLVRLFWQGSDTHQKDVAILRGPVNALNKQAGKLKMIMAGYVPNHSEWYKMVMDYTAFAKTQYKLIPFQPVTSYYAAYAEADICLVPLLESAFNKHKSPLKILEAANMGLPVIASEVDPYLDFPVHYASNSTDWVRHIKSLMRSRGNRRDAGERLKEFCDENYNFGKINGMRKQLFEYVTKKEPA